MAGIPDDGNGIDVIVVGAGYAGLACDIITLAANATIVMEKWGDVVPIMAAESATPRVVTFKSDKGEVLLTQDWRHKYNGHYNLYTSRARSQGIVYDYAVQIGVKSTFNARITDYYGMKIKLGYT
ncbi:dihydrodipicolinate synthetase family protein [Fonsecaea monophora]|uniref:Dihydrodipicolinate synthetase family protein n=1 Tax=Fonsecaea monophora TaxID=254056 RepID=A0A177FMQ5_9EURO|nr:dihydrodipicolinate synthetase family protein [Fonsecaea monophora]OAG45081.1 dihydrodipicolinate synthetase family protein [Fonsecaea monophora]